MRPKAIAIVAAAQLALATTVLYAPVLGFGFVDLDDPIHLVQNDRWRGLGAEQLGWIFFERHGSAGYDPLAWLSYAADHALFGLDAAAFHRTNLALFALCVLALFDLARRVLADARGAESPGSVVVAGCVAALWALHPLRVEQVAWLSERHGLLATLFALLATRQYLRIRTRELAHIGATGPWALCLAFFAAALLSKGTVIFLPVCFLVLDATLLERLEWPPRRAELHDRIVEKLPFFVLSLIVGLATVTSRQESGMWTTSAEMGLPGRLAQTALGLAWYPWKTLVPTSLSPIQLREEWIVHASWAYVVAGIAVFAVAGLAFELRRRVPAVAAALIAYALLLLPVLGLVQSGPLVVADRYSGLALVPLFLLGGLGANRLWDRTAEHAPRRALVAGVAIATVLLAAEAWATRRQLEHWRSADSLWQRVISESHEPGLAWLNRALIRHQLGDEAGADRAFAQAIAAGRDEPLVLGIAGETAAHVGDDARALALLEAATTASPDLVFAWRARAQLLARSGQPEEAHRALQLAIAANPEDGDLQRDLEALLRARRSRPQPDAQP